jgi:hypothetical protein
MVKRKMPELPEPEHQTVNDIYNCYKTNSGDWRRDHLGASIIGRECERQIWYSFRWCTNPDFNGRMLRLFATGHSQEARLLKDLKAIGISVYDLDPETGKQIHYTDFGGHYSGSLDAIGRGFVEAPETFHVIECKTMNIKTFNSLKSKGVRAVKFEHYCQMQVYMGWSGLTRAFYLAVCKDTDELYGERIYFDQSVSDKLRVKADRIVFSDNPLYRIGTSENDFKCKFCEHKDLCYGTRLPEVNCRTCAFSDVIDDGGWMCNCPNNKHVLSPLLQRQGCEHHVFIPSLVPLKQTDADAEKGWIIYGDIINGYSKTLSINMQRQIDNI